MAIHRFNIPQGQLERLWPHIVSQEPFVSKGEDALLSFKGMFEDMIHGDDENFVALCRLGREWLGDDQKQIHWDWLAMNLIAGNKAKNQAFFEFLNDDLEQKIEVFKSALDGGNNVLANLVFKDIEPHIEPLDLLSTAVQARNKKYTRHFLTHHSEMIGQANERLGQPQYFQWKTFWDAALAGHQQKTLSTAVGTAGTPKAPRKL